MEITYLGHSSFKLRGKNVTVVTDPYDSDMVGIKFPRHTSADIVTVSHDHADHNAVNVLEGSPFIVRGPGEYEIKGVSIIGVAAYHDNEKGAKRGRNTLYNIHIDGISIAHLGDLGHELTSSEVEALGNVDILLIPVGGTFTIDAETAAKVVAEIDPKIVIPMHYGRPELNPKTFGDLLTVGAFLKEMGKETIIPQSKLAISKDKLPQELQVVVLQ